MPRYDGICDDCGTKFDYLVTLEMCDWVPRCPICDSNATRKVFLSAPMGFVKGKFEPFKSKVDGSIITCQRDLEEHNKKNNVVLLGDGYDNETILAGNFGKKEELTDRDRKQDIVEAVQALNAGYKPDIRPDTPVEEL